MEAAVAAGRGGGGVRRRVRPVQPIPVSKARGRKASLTALVDRMEATAIDPAGQTVFISHGDCLEDAEFVAGEVRRRLGVETVHINYVGPVIGNHSGPGTMALFFLGSER